jgi:hypothetical protein
MTSEERLLLIKQKFAKLERDKQLDNDFAMSLRGSAKLTTSTYLRQNAETDYVLRKFKKQSHNPNLKSMRKLYS